MNKKTQQEARLIQNLLDAGCQQAFVDLFMDKHTANNLSEQIRLLTVHRSTILCSVHEEQYKLDCIDYLLYQLKNNRQTLTDVS